MGRKFWIPLICLAALATASGCAKNASRDLYTVVFSGSPNLFDPGVYAGGIQIGEIRSTEPGPGNTVKVLAFIDGEHRRQMTRSTVFFVSSGRLNHAALSAYAEPLPVETPVLGFSSRFSLAAFRLKTLLGQPAETAARQADRLFGPM